MLTQAPCKHLRLSYKRPENSTLPEQVPKYHFRSSITPVSPFPYSPKYRSLCKFALWNREEKNIMLQTECIQIQKKNLHLRNVFYARKMAPSSQGSVSIYLIKIQLESQPSVLKIIYEEAAEGQTWGETTGASLSTSRNFTFSSGKLCEGQKRRLNLPHLSCCCCCC